MTKFNLHRLPPWQLVMNNPDISTSGDGTTSYVAHDWTGKLLRDSDKATYPMLFFKNSAIVNWDPTFQAMFQAGNTPLDHSGFFGNGSQSFLIHNPPRYWGKWKTLIEWPRAIIFQNGSINTDQLGNPVWAMTDAVAQLVDKLEAASIFVCTPIFMGLDTGGVDRHQGWINEVYPFSGGMVINDLKAGGTQDYFVGNAAPDRFVGGEVLVFGTAGQTDYLVAGSSTADWPRQEAIIAHDKLQLAAGHAKMQRVKYCYVRPRYDVDPDSEAAFRTFAESAAASLAPFNFAPMKTFTDAEQTGGALMDYYVQQIKDFFNL